jgi:hypothetical protein
MYPHERSLVKHFEGKPFAIVGINSDSDRDKLKKAMTDEGITWRSWFDGGRIGGPIAKRWNVQGWPTLYVVDRLGKIQRKYLGSPRDAKAMEEMLDKLVQEAEGSGNAKALK